MKDCSHLIAVVSENTEGSWWVPFEIGEATIIDNRIATFQVGYVTLPEYLKKWPKMTTMEHLKLFAIAYKADYPLAFNRKLGGESVSTSSRSSEQFHYNLKRNLGQIY